jgi:hypothetical protein
MTTVVASPDSPALQSCKRLAHIAAIDQHCRVGARFDFVLEGAGWLSATLDAGDKSWTAQASSMSDAPEDFLDAVLAILYGASWSEALWWEEPQAARPFEFMRWVFERQADAVATRIVGHNDNHQEAVDGTLMVEATLEVDAFGRLMWGGVSHAVSPLSDVEYTQEWRSSSDRQGIVQRLDEIQAALNGVLLDATRERLGHDRRTGFGGYRSSLNTT